MEKKWRMKRTLGLCRDPEVKGSPKLGVLAHNKDDKLP